LFLKGSKGKGEACSKLVAEGGGGASASRRIDEVERQLKGMRSSVQDHSFLEDTGSREKNKKKSGSGRRMKGREGRR